jgi:hypothetical protein
MTTDRLEQIVIDEDGIEGPDRVERRRVLLAPMGGAQRASFGWQIDTWMRLDQLIPALLEAQKRVPEHLRHEARVKLGYDPDEIVVVYPRPETEDEERHRVARARVATAWNEADA